MRMYEFDPAPRCWLPANSPLPHRVIVTVVRADGINQWNANLRRDISLKERMRLDLRLDALNLQNRSQFNPPEMSPYSTNLGKITSQTSSLNRFYQIQARVQF
ncbi:MAG: hypothetical protein AAB225_31785 [Acidobacteriota bacterium]